MKKISFGWLKRRFLEIAVILACTLVLAFFAAQKEGYHMDELLSFELSNGLFNPWIVPTQPQGRLAKFVEEEIRGEKLKETVWNLKETAEDVLKNGRESKLLSYQADVYEEPVWIAAEQFQEYVTVDGQDAFQYLSVYFNVKDDNHPPLHFMLLHTVSSLFRKRLEPFMGCVINLAAAAGTMALLMKLGGMLGACFGLERHRRAVGLLAALLYGLSTGAVATVLLIRMYGVLTFFCTALFYLCLKKWLEGGFEGKNKLLIAVTVLGFLTQYFFLFYCIFLTAVLLCLLLLYRRRRECFCLVRSMAIAAAAGLLLFPFAVSDVFASGRGTEALNSLSEGFSGYGERLSAFFEILCSRTFGGFFWVLGILGVICLLYAVCRKKRISGKKAAVLCLLTAAPAGYFFLAARMSPYLVDRYIMPLFPFAALGGALLAGVWAVYMEELLGKAFKKRSSGRLLLLAGCWAVLFQGVRLAGYDGSYLYRGYEQQQELAREYREIPCLCVYEGVGYYENLPEFMEYARTLLLKPQELTERKERESLQELTELIVLLKPGVDENSVEQTLAGEYGFSSKKVLLSEGVHGDKVYLLEK